MQRIVLHVDLDSFYASLEELRHEDIRGKPVVICVYSGRSPDSGAVRSATYKARQLGIKAGMPIVFAKRLAKDKDVAFLPTDIEYYRTVSDRMMEILEEEADAIQQVSIDEAYLDVTGRSGDDWDAARKIAEGIKRRVKDEEGLTCSIGIGPNKLIAKMASERQKPDGLTVVKDTQVAEFLRNLPVMELYGIGGKTAEALNELGIKTVNELAEFELKILEENFGENKAVMLQQRAKGIDDSPVEQKEPQQISRMGTLKEDSNNLEAIFGKIRELAADVTTKAEKKDVSFRTISVILIDTGLKAHTRSETIQPTDNMDAILKTVKSLLARFLEENSGIMLRRVGIRVSNLTHNDERGIPRGLDKYLGEGKRGLS